VLAAGARDHLVTTAIEHDAILETTEALQEEGKRATIVGVDEQGLVDPDQIRAAVEPQTALVSVMLANNEIGTVQRIGEIAEIAHVGGALMHTDAVQAAGRLPLNVRELQVDLLSLSAHKLYGPKGTGALYVGKGTRLGPLQRGGGQEMGRRGGTENVAGIVGFGKACEIAGRDMAEETPRLVRLRDRLRDGILERVPGAAYTGHPVQRLPHIAHFTFEGALGETIVVALDAAGIAASAGSACSAGAVHASHVLLALGLPPERAPNSLRLSLGRATTDEHIERVLEVLPGIVERVRAAASLHFP
jgi:cysteine desulfurase